jgi:hypothetical protein
MMFSAISGGMSGLLTDSCYYACALANPNNLQACANNCCAANPDPSDSLCSAQGNAAAANLSESPAEMSAGVVSDLVDAYTGNYAGGSNAAAAVSCANNPTFACWWQQNGTTMLIGVGALVGVFAIAELLKAAK